MALHSSRAHTRTSWRVRYLRDDGTYGSQSGFHTRKAAEDYAHDLDTDRRRGTWLDPAGAKKPLTDWAAIWIETLDVAQRTEENYRRYLRRQILPRWGHTALGDITSLDGKTCAAATPLPPSPASAPCCP